MKEISPNVVIAGAPKSGTSSLFFWLSSHPEVCGSRVKETFYFHDQVHERFNKNANFITHQLSKYAQFWSHYNNQKIILEATAQYIYFKNALEQLPLLTPKPKVIILLRAPEKRLYSLFKFNKFRLGQVPQNVDFKQYITSLKDNNITANPFLQSDYLSIIKTWEEAIGKENLLVYQFEKMQQNKVAFMQQIADDLGIDRSFYADFDFFTRNETRSMKSHKLHFIGLKIQPYIPIWLQEKVFIPLYLKFNSSKAPITTPQETAYLTELKQQFSHQNSALAQKFPGFDLKLWD